MLSHALLRFPESPGAGAAMGGLPGQASPSQRHGGCPALASTLCPQPPTCSTLSWPPGLLSPQPPQLWPMAAPAGSGPAAAWQALGRRPTYRTTGRGAPWQPPNSPYLDHPTSQDTSPPRLVGGAPSSTAQAPSDAQPALFLPAGDYQVYPKAIRLWPATEHSPGAPSHRPQMAKAEPVACCRQTLG